MPLRQSNRFPHVQSTAQEHPHGFRADWDRLLRTAPDRRRLLRWLGAGGATTLPLLGCGGGGTADTDSALPASSTATVDTRFFANLSVTGERVFAQAVSTTDSAAVFAFAEQAYPTVFPAGSTTQSATEYLFRFYANTGNYIGVTADSVYVLGPITAQTLVNVGTVAQVLALASGSTVTSCSTIPAETAGPYPGDGTNSNSTGVANALTLSGIVRSDIRSSIAGATGVATGVPLTVRLKLVNTSASCANLAGYAVYLWHCDALGRYSMYSSGATSENYLRGVQVADAAGEVSFTTVFPGCYSGRWPHIHFEVFRSVAQATSGNNDIRTSQLAFAQEICAAVYATSGYTGSAGNLAQISLASDNIFSDGFSLQMASVTGSVSAGYQATLQVGVAG